MPRPSAPPDLTAPPPPDLAALVAGLIGRRIGDGERVAVAVSGGPDSMALLWLAATALPGRLLALTVDHGLRAGSADEAAMVADHCARHGIAHRSLAWTGAKPDSGRPAAARDARYALLAAACRAAGATLLLTAHHRDDQAETLLMRLARGAGGTGLAGIRAVRPLADDLLLVRPLLGHSRAMLRQWLAAAGWPSVADPSNDDPAHLRTRARALLAATDWLPAHGLARAAANLAAAEAALAWAADRAWAGAATVAGDAITLDIADLPAELCHRLVARAVASLAPGAAPEGGDIAALVARLSAGGTATLAGVRVDAAGGLWRFTLAPPRRDSRGKTS